MFMRMIVYEGRSPRSRSHFIIGNGKKGVKFWKDRWCENLALEEDFPSLFSIVPAKDSWVVEEWKQVMERDWWSPHFSKQFHNWELKGVTVFFQKLHTSSVRRDEDDRIGWKEPKCSKLFVKSFYDSLVQGRRKPFPTRAQCRIPRFV